MTCRTVRDPYLPPVSVVMVVYNGELYVEAAIDSILNQTHADFEFVIVDDGSTDRTPLILADYAALDRRLRVVTQQNLGQVPALNRALKIARHDWVAIIDHDDISFPQRLECQLRAIAADPKVRVLGSHAIKLNADGTPGGVLRPGPTNLEEYWKVRRQGEWVQMVHPGVIMHRPTILALGGYRAEFGVAADSELWSRVADVHPVYSLPKPLVGYRLHGQNMSIVQFFDGQEMLRWIMARQHARRAGNPEPSLAQLRQSSKGWLGLCRLNFKRRDWVAYLQWQARLAWRANRRAHAMVMLGGATVLGPIWIAGRAWRRATRRMTGVIGQQEWGDHNSDVPLAPANTNEFLREPVLDKRSDRR